MSATYSTNEVCDMAGVTYRQLDHWTRQRVVAPAAEPGNGSGVYRRWAARQVAVVSVLGQVAALGALNRPGSQLVNLAQFLEDLPLRYWHDTRVLLDAEGQVWRLEPVETLGAPLVGTYVDLAAAGPVIELIAARRSA